jgi:hypothetical protein
LETASITTQKSVISQQIKLISIAARRTTSLGIIGS